MKVDKNIIKLRKKAMKKIRELENLFGEEDEFLMGGGKIESLSEEELNKTISECETDVQTWKEDHSEEE